MGELLNHRESNTKVVSDGGQKTVSLFASNIHYLDESGAWSLKDTTIYSNIQARPRKYDYVTKANSFALGFKGKANAPEFVSFMHGRGTKGTVKMTLNGLYYYDHTTGDRMEIAVPNASAPVLEGLDKLVYPEVFTGASLELVSEGEGIKENIILTSKFKSILPDPILNGFDPATLKVVFSVSFSSQHGHRKASEVAFLGQDGVEEVWLAPVVAHSQVRRLEPFEEFNDLSGEFLYGISYNSTQLANYPIVIDPTLYVNKSNADYAHIADTNGSKVAGAIAGSATGTITVGVSQTDDGKGAINKYNRRVFTRFYIEAYKDSTIYGTCKFYAYLSIVAGARATQIDEIVDWYSIDTGDWSNTVNFACGQIPQSGAYSACANDIKSRLVVQKHATPPNPTDQANNKKVIAFLVRSSDETFPSSGNLAGTSISVATGEQPKIEFQSYDTFTQNAPSAGDGQVTVSWINGGGLVTGDVHRIYYKAGTGLDAATIISNNTFVETTVYDATTIDVAGLTNGTAYSFVVVDCQKVGTSFYEGARSSIQTATPTNSVAFPIAVTVNCDTKRKANNLQAPQGDSKRKTLKVVSANMDTKRSLRQVIAATFDTYRKLRNTITVNADSKRGLSKLVAVAADSRRKVVTLAAIVGDSFRKVNKSVSVTGDSKRFIRTVVSVLADTRRNILSSASVVVNLDTRRRIYNAVTVTTDTKRKVTNLATVAVDTFRKVHKSVYVNGDTYRKTRKHTTVDADTRRKPTNLVTTVIDTRRKIVRTVSLATDTYRKVRKNITVQADTMRKMFSVVHVLADTLRKVFDELTRPVRNSIFKIKEKPYNYQWKEFDNMAKILKLGEQKEVGIEVKALDGGTFTITSATYVYKKADDTVLASGNATINDNNVFALINAADKGSSQQVEFTVTITPSNVGKSVEVHKQVIEITVK